MILKRKAIGGLLVLCFILGLSGCGSSEAYNETSTPTENYKIQQDYSDYSSSGYDSTNSTTDNIIQNDNRKLVYTSDISLECSDVKTAVSDLRQDVASVKGYIETSSCNTYNDYIDYSLTAKIPTAEYSKFIETVNGYGTITSQSENIDDITRNYVDVQARLDSLNQQKDKLLSLESEADDLDALMQIESSLSDVQYQLESYQSQLNVMNNQVSYCTINFSMTQPSIVSPIAKTFGAKAAAAFSNGFTIFIEFFENLILAVITLLPFIIIIVVFISLFILWRKKHPKRNKIEKAIEYIDPNKKS